MCKSFFITTSFQPVVSKWCPTICNVEVISWAYLPLHCLHVYKMTPLHISMVIEG